MTTQKGTAGADSAGETSWRARARDIVRPFQSAFSDYTDALRDSWEDLQSAHSKAYQEHLERLRDSWGAEDAQQRCADSCREYQDLCRKAQESAAAANLRAFRKAVGALQQAWAAADPEVVDVETLKSIGQATGTLASYACWAGTPKPVSSSQSV